MLRMPFVYWYYQFLPKDKLHNTIGWNLDPLCAWILSRALSPIAAYSGVQWARDLVACKK